MSDNISKRLLPREPKVGQVKTFRLINAGRIDSASGQPAFNAGATFEGVTTIYDPYEENPSARDKIIRNVVGRSITKNKEGKEEIKEVIDQIRFDQFGLTYVKHDQYNTYVFLALHNACGTNKNRDKSKPILWEEVTYEDKKEKEKMTLDLHYQAQKMIRDGDIKDVIAIGEQLAKKKEIEINLKGKPSDIRFELSSYATRNPAEVIRCSKDELSKIKLDVQDAANIGEIGFDIDSNEWVWEYEPDRTKKSLASVKPGYDPIESLAEELLAEEVENKKKPAAERGITRLSRLKNTLKETSPSEV